MIIHSILVAIPETKLKQPNGHCQHVHLPRGCQQYWARGQTALSGLESCSADDPISALHSIAKCQPSACQLFPEVGSLDHYFLRYSSLPSGNRGRIQEVWTSTSTPGPEFKRINN